MYNVQFYTGKDSEKLRSVIQGYKRNAIPFSLLKKGLKITSLEPSIIGGLVYRESHSWALKRSLDAYGELQVPITNIANKITHNALITHHSCGMVRKMASHNIHSVLLPPE